MRIKKKVILTFLVTLVFCLSVLPVLFPKYSKNHKKAVRGDPCLEIDSNQLEALLKEKLKKQQELDNFEIKDTPANSFIEKPKVKRKYTTETIANPDIPDTPDITLPETGTSRDNVKQLQSPSQLADSQRNNIFQPFQISSEETSNESAETEQDAKSNNNNNNSNNNEDNEDNIDSNNDIDEETQRQNDLGRHNKGEQQKQADSTTTTTTTRTKAENSLSIVLPSNSHVMETADEASKLLQSSKLSFFVVGNWGTGSARQKQVAKAMRFHSSTMIANSLHRPVPSFVVSTGDQFYYVGATSVQDSKFQTHFENVYGNSKTALTEAKPWFKEMADMFPKSVLTNGINNLAHIPWFMTLGNHDCLGNISAQVLYTSQSIQKRRTPNWIMPSTYYTFIVYDNNTPWQFQAGKTISSPTANPLIQFFVLDGCVLTCSPDPLLTKSSKKERVEEMCSYFTNSLFDTKEKNWNLAQEQYSWLESELEKSRADWKFVVIHWPIYNSLGHGDTWTLKGKLPKLLQKHQVSACFSGHALGLEHISFKLNSHSHQQEEGSSSSSSSSSSSLLHQFVSGGGGFPPAEEVEIEDKPYYNLEFIASAHGFLIVTLDLESKANMTVSIIGPNGKSMYEATIPSKPG